MEAIVDSVGRIVVPEALRDALGLAPGSTVDLSLYGAGLQLVPSGRTARLPADARLAPAQAVQLIDANFEAPVLVPRRVAVGLPGALAPLGVAGGAVHDALVALAAPAAGLPLATRDRRAAATYAALQVRVELVS